MRDAVCCALRDVDSLGMLGKRFEGVDHYGEFAAALDDALGVCVEQVEKLPLAGHETS